MPSKSEKLKSVFRRITRFNRDANPEKETAAQRRGLMPDPSMKDFRLIGEHFISLCIFWSAMYLANVRAQQIVAYSFITNDCFERPLHLVVAATYTLILTACLFLSLMIVAYALLNMSSRGSVIIVDYARTKKRIAEDVCEVIDTIFNPRDPFRFLYSSYWLVHGMILGASVVIALIYVTWFRRRDAKDPDTPPTERAVHVYHQMMMMINIGVVVLYLAAMSIDAMSTFNTFQELKP